MRINVSLANANLNVRSQAKLYALRELMKLEMPDRVSDVMYSVDESSPRGLTIPARHNNQRFYEPFSPPAAWRYYRARAAAANPATGWTFQHQGAECLYMILSKIEVGENERFGKFL